MSGARRPRSCSPRCVDPAPMTRSGDGRRVGRMGAPHLVPGALALAATLAVWLGWGQLVSCGTIVESAETAIRRALASQTRANLADVYGFRAGGTVELHDLRFADVVPSVEGGRGPPGGGGLGGHAGGRAPPPRTARLPPGAHRRAVGLHRWIMMDPGRRYFETPAPLR